MLKVIKFPFRKFSSLLGLSLIVITLFFYKPVYAAGETQIVPTWSQSSQQSEWANKFRVTNFCESSNNPQNYSCQLTITVNGDYYGYVYFDGYINNQIIWDYQTMFISGGKGTFYYTWYHNGLMEINKVNIAGLSLFSPTDDIDLSQIIDLLTSINSYNQQEVGNQSTQIQQLQTVINDFIVSNGYLETLTKLRQFNVPFESYGALFNLLTYKNVYEYQNLYSFNYPIFQLNNGNVIFRGHSAPNRFSSFIISFNKNIWSLDELLNYIDIVPLNGTYQNVTFKRLYYNGGWSTIKITLDLSENNFYDVICKLDNTLIIPIYVGYTDVVTSVDFALLFEFHNQLLDDLHIIANGTASSNSSVSGAQSTNNSFVQSQNQLFSQEDNFNQNMNDSLNQIDTNFSFDSNFGSSFIRSSEWVKTQFDRMTGSTPFGSILGFSLLLGVGLLIIGKVLG